MRTNEEIEAKVTEHYNYLLDKRQKHLFSKVIFRYEHHAKVFTITLNDDSVGVIVSSLQDIDNINAKTIIGVGFGFEEIKEFLASVNVEAIKALYGKNY